MDLIHIIGILCGIAIVAAVFIIFKKLIYKNNLDRNLSYKLLMVSLPKETNIGGQPDTKKFQELISGFEQFLASLANYKKPIVLELATPTDTEEIIFFIAAPRRDSQLIEKNISAYYPFAQVEPVDDYTIFESSGKTAAARVKLGQHFALPIRTYASFDYDPLSSITNALSLVAKQNEGGAMQIIIAPVDKSKKKIVQNILKNLREGKSLKDALKLTKLLNIDDFKGMTNSPKDEKKKEEDKFKPRPVDEVTLKIIEEKLSRPLFNVDIRLLASAETKERSEDILHHMISSLKQLEAPNSNNFNIQEIKSRAGLDQFVFDFAFRNFKWQEAMILNTAEIASLYHLPHAYLETPKIKWLKSRSAPAPVDLPTQGVILGINTFRGEQKQVKILDEDRRRHIYSIGQTGTGKTTLMKNMFISDMATGKGVCFIDPHGDVAEELLGYVPKNRINDVIYFNPADPHRAIGLNMLEWSSKYAFQKSFVTNELLEILDKLYDLKVVGGPVFEQYFRNALLLLLDDPGKIHTINDVPRILINPDFRRELLEKTPNPMVREFWEKEADKAGGELALANVAPYINSKLNPFLANDLVRPIISQTKSSIDFRSVMDEGKILIVNLSKGLLGDINSYLLGMVVVGKLMMAAFSRVDLPENDRKDFYLYIDEFQNITTNTVSTIFSEARKYRLNLMVANQFLGQLKEGILKSVFGNVGTVISFRVGSEDAEIMAKYFAPVFNNYDLINLDNYNAYVKLTIRGQTSRAFNIKTIKPSEPNLNQAAQIKEVSSLRYGRPINEVEQEIRDNYQSIV